MTLSRSGEGTANYTPPSAGGFTPDVFGLARPAMPTSVEQQRTPARFFTQKIDKDGNVYYWRMELRDTRGGLNLQRGNFDEAHDRLASSTLDSRYRSHLILPPLKGETTSPDAYIPGAGIRSAHVFGTLMIAAGAGDVSTGNGPVIFKETSATDPTITSVTFNPGVGKSVVSGQAAVLNSAPQFIVGFDTLAAQAFSDAAGTVVAMHANTIFCCGIIQTPINTNALLIYANGGLYTLASTSAIAAAPTSVLTNVPNGGWALGLLSLGGGPIRAWWVWPTRTGVLEQGSNGLSDWVNARGARLMNTNLQGTDPQELKLTGLRGITTAFIIRDGIFASDGTTAIHHNGRFVRPLRWNVDPTANSDRRRFIMGGWAVGDDLYVEVNEIASTGGSGDCIRWIEWYNWDLDCWHQVTSADTITGITKAASFGAGASLPASKNTGFIHGYVTTEASTDTTGVWKRYFMPPPTTNPFTRRKTSGATSGTGVQFSTTGTGTWPAMQVPGLEGWPMAVRRISGNPQIDIGGGTPTTNPSVAVSVGGVSATFVYGQTQGRQEFQFFDNENVVYELQPVITLTQQGGGTDPTRTTPQALPIIIEGIAVRPEFQVGASIGDFTR